VIYLKVNGNWLTDGARFAAYFYGGSGDDIWMSMTADVEADVFKCDVPKGYGKVVFVRLNPDSSANNWDEGVKWSQTGDQSVMKGKCFVLDYGSWDSGSWQAYTPGTDPDEPGTDPENPGTDPDNPGTKPVRIYISHIWSWNYGLWCWDSAGNQIFGNGWPGQKPDGTEVIDSQTYSYWTVPADQIGKTVSLLITDGNDDWTDKKQQTEDYTDLTLSESVYFSFEYRDDKNWLVKL